MIFAPPPSIPEWHGPRSVHRLDDDEPAPPVPTKRVRIRPRTGVQHWPGRWKPWRLIEPGMLPVSAKGVAGMWRLLSANDARRRA